MILALAGMELPIRIRLDHRMTDAELMRFCMENEPMRVERDGNGELIVMSPVGSEGGSLEGEIVTELILWARGDGRGKGFGPNAGFTLADGSVRAADAAWVSWKRWNGLTEAQRKGFAPICPEFVMEVRSESDGLAALQTKMEMWIANGAEVGWLIDPKTRTVTVYQAGKTEEVYQDPPRVRGSGIVDGFELVMSGVWG